MLYKAHVLQGSMAERVDFAGLSLPRQHFPPEATPVKPPGTLREKSTAQGVQIQHHPVLSCSFSRELLQVITLAAQSGAGAIQHRTVLPLRRGESLLDNWVILKSCLQAARVPLHPVSAGAVTAAGDMSFFGRLWGRVTDQGFDVSSRGTRSSCPRQISASGWRRSVANNSSIALRGVRSAEESTMT